MIYRGPRNDARGFSLVEALVVAGLMGFIALSASALVFPFFYMTKQVRANLVDTVDNDLSSRILATELTRSYLMRLDGLSCGPSDALFKVSSATETFEMNDNARLVFLTSMFSTTGARDKNANDVVSVGDAIQFPEGSVVLAMSPLDSSSLGLFRVTGRDLSNSKVTLQDFAFSSNPTSCSFGGTSATLENLFQASKGSTLNLHRVRFVHYLRKKDQVLRAAFPEDGDLEEPKSIAFTNLKKMTISSSWASYEGAKTGRWNGKIDYQFEFPALVKNQPAKNVKTSSQVSFDLAGTKRTNTAARTTSQLESLVFPTCSVAISGSPIELSFQMANPALQSQFQNAKVVLVEGAASIDSPASISATIQVADGSFVSCYPLDLSLYSDPVVRSPGVTSSITLTSAAGVFTKSLCALRGSIHITSTMKYYDPAMKKMIGINCSEASMNTASSYVHKGGNQARCYKDGMIDFGGPLIESGTQRPGPQLHVGAQSCRWSDSGGDFVSCAIGSRAPTAELREVRVLPHGLSGLSNSQGHYEINCH